MSFKLTHNEQGLALLGYLKNVSRQLKPKIVLKVEDKNKKPNSIPSSLN